MDYASWPIKELRRFLTERGEDSSGCTEKAELAAKVRAVAERGPEGADELPQIPAGDSVFYLSCIGGVMTH